MFRERGLLAMINIRNEQKWFTNDSVRNIEKYFNGVIHEHADDGTKYNCYSFVHGLCNEQRAITDDARDIIIKQINSHQSDELWLLQAEALLYKWFAA
jgi:hypothetical protein